MFLCACVWIMWAQPAGHLAHCKCFLELYISLIIFLRVLFSLSGHSNSLYLLWHLHSLQLSVWFASSLSVNLSSQKNFFSLFLLLFLLLELWVGYFLSSPCSSSLPWFILPFFASYNTAVFLFLCPLCIFPSLSFFCQIFSFTVGLLIECAPSVMTGFASFENVILLLPMLLLQSLVCAFCSFGAYHLSLFASHSLYFTILLISLPFRLSPFPLKSPNTLNLHNETGALFLENDTWYLSLAFIDLDSPLDDLQAAIPFAWVKSLLAWCSRSTTLLLTVISYFTRYEYHAQKLTIFHGNKASDTNRICYKRKWT